MSIDRFGRFLQVRGEDGIRHIARIAAVQLVSDADETGLDSIMVIAGRAMLIHASLDQLRDALVEDTPFDARDLR